MEAAYGWERVGGAGVADQPYQVRSGGASGEWTAGSAREGLMDRNNATTSSANATADHDIDALLALLTHDGTLTLVGAPAKPLSVSSFSLLMGRRKLAGSLIGGIRETQEMLDFCGQHGITSDVEVIPVQQVNQAYERLLKGDVRYRFVLDMATLAKG